jgi:hypothetical protein
VVVERGSWSGLASLHGLGPLMDSTHEEKAFLYSKVFFIQQKVKNKSGKNT